MEPFSKDLKEETGAFDVVKDGSFTHQDGELDLLRLCRGLSLKFLAALLFLLFLG